ncbi:MAG: hypothetical protein J6X49_02090 [Victivallales bacterium]|nr:hypothetical protein [Victivallales bacterium]
MGRLTKIYRDKKDDPYRRLLEQLTREDELEGCVLITVRKKGDAVTIDLHKGAKEGNERSIDSLSSIFSLGFETAHSQYEKEMKQAGGDQ